MENRHRDKEELLQMYNVEHKPISAIAKECGVCAMTVHKWMVKNGIERRAQGSQPGRYSANWKGGKDIRICGKYLGKYVPGHPRKSLWGYVPIHKLVMEEHLGRYLTKSERVHHKNGNPMDNRLENLQYFESESAHQTYESKMKAFVKDVLFGDREYPHKAELLENLEDYLNGSQ